MLLLGKVGFLLGKVMFYWARSFFTGQCHGFNLLGKVIFHWARSFFTGQGRSISEIFSECYGILWAGGYVSGVVARLVNAWT